MSLSIDSNSKRHSVFSQPRMKCQFCRTTPSFPADVLVDLQLQNDVWFIKNGWFVRIYKMFSWLVGVFFIVATVILSVGWVVFYRSDRYFVVVFYHSDR